MSDLDGIVRWRLLAFQSPRVKPEFGGPDVSVARFIELERSGVEFLDGFVFRFGGLPRLLERAKHDREDFETLRRLMENVVRQGEGAPPDIAALGADFIGGKISPPRQHGKHRHANFLRDVQIGVAILQAMEEYSVTVTDCCRMVAKSEKMTFDAVRKIWDKKCTNIFA